MKTKVTERIYVAVDLETTGLNPETDAIIEVGAVKFQNGDQIDKFHSMVNPHRQIPYFVRNLCHIAQNEVDDAPDFSLIAEDLRLFVEGCSPVGHNVSFDLNFLARAGVNILNPSCDTYDLVRLMLPDIPERSLTAVAEYLEIPHPSAHRALADAEVSRDVFEILLGKLGKLEPSIISELARLTVKTDWWLGSFIQELAEEIGVNALLGEAGFEKACFGSGKREIINSLKPADDAVLLDIEEMEGFFDSEGPLSKAFENYEVRSEQIEMMKAVVEAFNGGTHLIVEAGTGTGKSMAYLLPSLFFAQRNNVPVVVSTNTINLQEQLMYKDIPDLLQSVGMETEVEVAQVKGRTNYLCARRWNTLRKSDGLHLDIIQFLARIQVWLPSTKTGDRSELNIDAREQPIWVRICAQSYDCLGKKCSYQQRGLCFLQNARNRAQGAHLIVVNHALLLSEMVSGAQILPEYDQLIIDEAHHLEDVATDQLGVEVRERDIFEFLDQIIQQDNEQRFGFVPQLEVFVRTGELDLETKRELGDLNSSLVAGTARVASRVSEFFGELGILLQQYGEGQGEYDLKMRITQATRAQPVWSDVEIACENFIGTLGEISKAFRRLNIIIEDLPIPDNLKIEAGSLLNACEELRHQIDSLVFDLNENSIHWLTLGKKSNLIALYSAPLHVGPLLQESLYSQKKTLVLTGATLSIESNFNYLKSRIGIENARELLLGSPFDFPNAAKVYLVQDIPEPGRDGYHKALSETLISLCRASAGRCLVLFTSYVTLRSMHVAIAGPLSNEDISVMGQGIDGSPRKLLNALVNNPRTVLLGAASFWEGVDIAGDALSVLAIVRLPFNVPSDPVFAARSETFDKSFTEFALPQTAFRFKQGFGRLIRSKTDRGMMVVLDSRLSNRNYKSVFIDSLPPCQVEKGTAQNLPGVLKNWFGE